MAAFVLGNGISRQAIDPAVLAQHGPVYGCNALYRTFAPTVLVATDAPIAAAIQDSGYAQHHRFYTRRPRPESGALAVPQQYFGFSSGPRAMALAAIEGHDPIYLLGFDLGPDAAGQFNNVYASTEFYKRQGDRPTFVGNWVRQMTPVMRDHPGCQFRRVYGRTTAVITEFESVRNLERVEISEFLRRINTPKDL